MKLLRSHAFTTLHGAPPWNAKHHIVTIYECEADDFEKNADDKVLVGWLLTVKHHSSSINLQMHLQGNMNSCAKRDYSVKNLRFNPGNAHYDHIFIFADATTPGKCFCIITLTPTNSDRLLNFMKSSSSIGDLCTLIKPDSPACALGDQPIIGTIQPLVPVESSFLPLTQSHCCHLSQDSNVISFLRM